MAPKFGNYLFRNLKPSAPSSSSGDAGGESAGPIAIEDQEIVLRPEDFTSELAGALNWAILEPKEVRLKLKQTEGLMEGKMVLAAKVLRELYPRLVSDQIKEDDSFPLSLRSVVLQLQSIIGSPANASNATGGPDFDTPIAQVAREDEGFFKLEQNTHRPAMRETLAAEDSSSFFPLIREKIEPRQELQEIPAIQVVAPVPQQDQNSEEPDRVNPFADLPKPKIRPERPSPLPPARATDNSQVEEQEKWAVKPVWRRGLERLQELFLTDDLLDAAQVAQSLRAFPKVKAVLILLEDGTVLGGELPPNYQFDAASAAPSLMRAVRDFGTALTKTDVSALTLLADMPISIILEGRVCMLVAHEGRGLLPGMRDRFTDIAKALDALYAPGAENALVTGS